jgi:hypothetical protein
MAQDSKHPHLGKGQLRGLPQARLQRFCEDQSVDHGAHDVARLEEARSGDRPLT